MQFSDRIYLDHNATTPLRDEVIEQMTRVLRDEFGNPSSTHAEGAGARARVEAAREQVAQSLGTEPGRVFFTAGATEANNAVLRGVVRKAGDPARIVTTCVEHPSIEAPLTSLEAEGVEVVRLRVDGDGRISLDELKAELSDGTELVSVIWANNETGVLQPMQEIAELVAERGIALHVDATQALGKVAIDLRTTRVDYLSCSAHKLNGPKGTGCLVAPSASSLPAFLEGGGQEHGLRGGTENVAGIVGFGVACELAERELDDRITRYGSLRDRLWGAIRQRIPRVRLNGRLDQMVCNTLNAEFPELPGEVLLQSLDLEGVSVSAGAACHSGSISPSRVLIAMGRDANQARASLRFSVGHGVDETQIDRAVDLLADAVTRAQGAALL